MKKSSRLLVYMEGRWQYVLCGRRTPITTEVRKMARFADSLEDFQKAYPDYKFMAEP